MKRYPQLHHGFLADLPFEIARRPKSGKALYAIDLKTYAAADIEALAALRPKKRARIQEPQEPEPEEEEAEECPVCFDPMTGATATLVCGHLFCKDCITDWARSQATCPTCRETLQFAP
jgi:formate dehydrogenase maturation protein FdhE